MIIDIHCHYTLTRHVADLPQRFSFEPPPRGRPSAPDGCLRPGDFDSCVSPRALRRLSWQLVRRALGLPGPSAGSCGDNPGSSEKTSLLDRALMRHYEQHLWGTGLVERFVLLAFDAVYDDDGTCPPLPDRTDRLGSDIYTSNSFVRALCQRHPDRFLFGASVHPYRPNALECVEEVFAAGACLLKWIPLHHNINLTDPRAVAVLRKCAALGLPLLVHCGPEFSLATQRPQYESIRPLLEVLRRLRREAAMPCVIVAHAATPLWLLGNADSHHALLEALRGEFADAPLYADLAALTAWTKVPFLCRLRRRPELHARLLFGSDFPVPTDARLLRRELGRSYRQIAAIRSWPQRAAAACRQLGFNEIVFHRAAELLPHVPRPN